MFLFSVSATMQSFHNYLGSRCLSITAASEMSSRSRITTTIRDLEGITNTIKEVEGITTTIKDHGDSS